MRSVFECPQKRENRHTLPIPFCGPPPDGISALRANDPKIEG